ncbi:MAG: hypothetical protein AAFQ60_15970, partial [Pseudomonadota bacterium]
KTEIVWKDGCIFNRRIAKKGAADDGSWTKPLLKGHWPPPKLLSVCKRAKARPRNTHSQPIKTLAASKQRSGGVWWV